MESKRFLNALPLVALAVGALALLLMTSLLTGCGSSTVKVGWVGSSGPGRMGYRYTTFDGVERKTSRAEAGQTMTFDYDVTVEKGALLLKVVAPDGESIWETTFREDAADTVTLTAPQNGLYTIHIEGQATGGSFDISWSAGEFGVMASVPIDEAPDISALVLLPGIGMALVAIGFVIYTAVRRLGWGYLGLGALAWTITVALKFAWAIPINTPVYEALTGSLPETIAHVIFYVYVGVLTGVFEVAITWLVLRYTKLGQVTWKRALAFGLGFGALEALLLGITSLVGAATALVAPTTLPLAALERLALTNNPLYGLAPIWERFFTVLIHLFTNVLLFYAARKRASRWFWLAFAYKSGIDTVVAFAQFWGLDTVGHVWIIEVIVALWGIAGWLGTRMMQNRYPSPEENGDMGATLTGDVI